MHTNMRRTVAAACCCGTLALAGCGDDSNRKSVDRPPTPITVAGIVSDESISISPATFGAGPVNLTITNQSERAQRVTLEAGDVRQQTGSITPGGIATLKADLPTGEAVVTVNTGTIEPARLKVSAERPTAQNDLLQP